VRPIVLSVAGSDPSGGAGIQADLKSVEACGGYAVTVITSVTAQNTLGVRRVLPLDAEIVADQLQVLLDDLDVAAVKTGMLGSAAVARVLADTLQARPHLPLVVDPLLHSSTGRELNDADTLRAMNVHLAPIATLLTPNLPEAAEMTGLDVRTIAEAEQAGRQLVDSGWSAVLVKGGHGSSAATTDLLVTAGGARAFEAPRIRSSNTHGTGCVHASAIATALAAGSTLEQAVETARAFISGCIRHGLQLGHGMGPVDPLYRLHEACS
jgi:hydroxymethylpyrimidine/phosphomethylpyrimidine kinase